MRFISVEIRKPAVPGNGKNRAQRNRPILMRAISLTVSMTSSRVSVGSPNITNAEVCRSFAWAAANARSMAALLMKRQRISRRMRSLPDSSPYLQIMQPDSLSCRAVSSENC